jgi:PhzF family phenazine biosynthesis protein
MAVRESDGLPLVTMQQAKAEFVPFDGDLENIANAIGLTVNDLDPSLPLVYASAGTWTLLIPIQKLAAFRRMQPRNHLFPKVLSAMPRASVHPFCLETIDPMTNMHARHFSSPYSRTVEDPVTGTASGVMGVYHARHIGRTMNRVSLVIEQGHEIGRDGRVEVFVDSANEEHPVSIRGAAVYVGEFYVQ